MYRVVVHHSRGASSSLKAKVLCLTWDQVQKIFRGLRGRDKIGLFVTLFEVTHGIAVRTKTYGRYTMRVPVTVNYLGAIPGLKLLAVLMCDPFWQRNQIAAFRIGGNIGTRNNQYERRQSVINLSDKYNEKCMTQGPVTPSSDSIIGPLAVGLRVSAT